MKKCFCIGVSLLVSTCVLAQTKPVARPQVDPKASRKEIRVVARNTAAEVRAPLSVAELDIAGRVHAGRLPCELGQVVVLTPDPASRGFFNLRIGKESYHVSPEETTTGAIRLEDKAAGVVWLQLANKSMLMSQKLGKRLADECNSPAQILVAEAMLKNPSPSVLDAPAAPAVAAAPTMPVVPAVSAVPVVPTVPVVPEVPVAPAAPAVSSAPTMPVVPAVSAVPVVPAAPAVPVVPVVPAGQVVPAVPAVPEVPAVTMPTQ